LYDILVSHFPRALRAHKPFSWDRGAAGLLGRKQLGEGQLKEEYAAVSTDDVDDMGGAIPLGGRPR